jgi:hypothetical protein
MNLAAHVRVAKRSIAFSAFAVFLIIALVLPVPTAALTLYGGDPFYSDERKSIEKQIFIEPHPVNGSYTYEYPLTIPPGRNGLQPDISLVYSSQITSDISPFGYGWSISTPSIERIPRYGSDGLYNRNNFCDCIFFSSLDGEVISSSTSYGSEDYGPLVENGDFRKYEFVDNQWWRVTDKNGVVYKFGTAASTRQNSLTKTFKLNLYSYSRNNPVNLHDPTGEAAQFFAVPALSAILNWLGIGLTFDAVINTTESGYTNLILPRQYPSAFSPEEKTTAPYRFITDATLNFGSRSIPISQEGRVIVDSILFGSQYLPTYQGGSNASMQGYPGLFNNFRDAQYTSLNESILRLVQNLNSNFNLSSSGSGSVQGNSSSNAGGLSWLSSSQTSSLLGVASAFTPTNQVQADALQSVINSFGGGN